ncbi:extracellular solute-binding protein [Scatolibacter rhodanostii]|uniref:extracellular solute-binding protein n=1 Tax=Scatolibacter rhodanostii TaxID=2014781 RepID=UPI001FA8B916|nr:extracellular solute-binding protein [Scatolibacter rhodanostii]
MNQSVKKMVSSVLVILMTMVFTACSSAPQNSSSKSVSSGEKSTAQSETKQETSGEIPTVTIWGSGGQEVRESLQAVADAFNVDADYNTKAKVEVQFVVSGTSEQSLVDRITAANQAGETDTDYDLIALDDSGISPIIAQNGEDFFVPIDTTKIPNYENVVFKDNIIGDTFVPYRGTTVMLAYNSEVVSNPPKTTEELYQWIKDNPGRFTYCDPSTGGSGYTFATTAIYNQLPEEAATSPDTKWKTEHTEEWDKGFSLLAELHPYLYQTAGKVQYPMKNAGSLDLLANKQVDMTTAFVNMVLTNKSMGTLPESIKLQQLDPAFSGALAGFTIPKIGKDKEAALSVIDYYLSYEAQSISWNTMYASPVVDTNKLENLDHSDWLKETNISTLRYFAIGSLQKDIAVRWTEEIAPLAQ